MPLTEFKMELKTAPNPLYRLFRGTLPATADLQKNGYASFPNFLEADEVLAIRQAMTRSIEEGYANFQSGARYYLIPDPLAYDDVFWAAVKKPVLSVAENYFSRRAFLADTDCRRIPPVANDEVQNFSRSSSNWHRDIRGRQVKLMVYLSDVDQTGSAFAFVPGSHRRRHYSVEGRKGLSAVAEASCPIEWHGKAGDAMLFDTNLIHKLTRRQDAPMRDSLTLYFTPGQSLKKIKTGGHPIPDWLEVALSRREQREG